MKTPRILILVVCSCVLVSVASPAVPSRAAKPPLTPAPAARHARDAAPANLLLFGVAGQGSYGQPLNPGLLQQEYADGIHLRLLELDWYDLQPNGPGQWSAAHAALVQQRIDTLAAVGSDVRFTLDLGIEYAPDWAANLDRLVDQYGNQWQPGIGNGGGVNVYWSPTLRADVRSYIQQVFTNLDFHGRLWAVRIGPFLGELLYPQLQHGSGTESFWAYDATAQAQSPVPGWHPGQPSPNGEAERFYNWYVDNLAGTYNFMLTEIRHYFAGYVAPVTPGAGMTPTTAGELITSNLTHSSAQYYGTGNYWYRIFGEMGPDGNILHWASSVGDISGVHEDSPNWWDWSSSKQLAWMAHRLGRPIFAENPGHNAYDASHGAIPQTTMQWIFQAVQNYGYVGLLWMREDDFGNPAYASLDQYAAEIAAATSCGYGFSDVPDGSPFYAVVMDLVGRQAISGYADCTFRPGMEITRGQAAKVLVVALGLPLVNPSRADFGDVPVGSPFYQVVETAYQRGIIAGYSDNTFRPNNPITRAQLAKMMTVGRGWTLARPAHPTFVDVPASNGFYPFVETAYQHGVISGYNCGAGCLEFRPNGTATRAQGSKIIDLGVIAP